MVGTPQFDLQGLPLCQVCSLSSLFHVHAIELRITTVSVCHICSAHPCLRESLYKWPRLSVTLTEDQALHRRPHTHRNLKIMADQLPNKYWESLGQNGLFLQSLFKGQHEQLQQLKESNKCLSPTPSRRHTQRHYQCGFGYSIGHGTGYHNEPPGQHTHPDLAQPNPKHQGCQSQTI